MIDKSAQQQYEDAYVNKELMNKYLNQNLAQQGLANSGIANLYAQQNNTNYMNERANIAGAKQQAEQDLLDQYYSAKKEEQDENQKSFYDLAINKVNNSLNLTDNKLSENEMAQLKEYFAENKDNLGDTYLNMINQYIEGYGRNAQERETYEDTSYTKYLEKAQSKLTEGNTLEDDDYDILIMELDKVKSDIGEENYNNAKQTLTALKVAGDVMENLNSSNRLYYSDYTKLKSAIDELYQTGMLSKTDYNSLVAQMDEIVLAEDQEEKDRNSKYQKELQDRLYNTTGKEYESALDSYLALSDDALLEKALRGGVSNFQRSYKGLFQTIGDKVSKLWNKYIYN